MAAKRYTLHRPRGLDRDALVRAICKLELTSWAMRWKACLVIRQAIELATDGEAWLWAYGLHLALAGHEPPHGLGEASSISEGYEAGRGLLPAGAPLVLDWPMGQRRAIGSLSPGRCWLN